MTATFPRRQAQPSEMWLGTKYLIENEMMNAFDVSDSTRFGRTIAADNGSICYSSISTETGTLYQTGYLAQIVSTAALRNMLVDGNTELTSVP